MNVGLLELRRRVLRELQRSRAAFVLAGNRMVVDFLDESIAKMKKRVAWAAASESRKRRFLAPQNPKGFRKRRFLTPQNAQFATVDNRPDNGPVMRGD